MSPLELENLISEYNTYYNQGQISKEELVALLQGVNIMEGLGDDVESLQTKEMLNTILNSAITVASALA